MTLSWEIAFPVGTLILLLAVLWGFYRSKQRSEKEKAITETATKELYEHPDAYEHGEREALEKEAEEERRRQKRAGA